MINIENLSFSYTKKNCILSNIYTSCEPGKLTAILGTNGAGKSTLLNCINRILKPTSGIITINDKDTRSFSRRDMAQEVSLVAQQSSAPHTTVFESVLLGRMPHMNIKPTEHDLNIVADSLARLSLEDYTLRNVDELSGGELQKVVIARALAQQTTALLLDEPTNNLDPYNQHEVMQSVRDVIVEDNIIGVAVMHDLNLSLRYCDNAIFLKDSTIYCSKPVESITAEDIYNVYGINVDIIEHNGIQVVIPK